MKEDKNAEPTAAVAGVEQHSLNPLALEYRAAETSQTSLVSILTRTRQPTQTLTRSKVQRQGGIWAVTDRMLFRAYILLAVNLPTSWETRQQDYAAQNIKRPGSGAFREYDLRFANFLPSQTLPQMHFTPRTRNELPSAVVNRIFRHIGNTSLQKHTASHIFMLNMLFFIF